MFSDIEVLMLLLETVVVLLRSCAAKLSFAFSYPCSGNHHNSQPGITGQIGNELVFSQSVVLQFVCVHQLFCSQGTQGSKGRCFCQHPEVRSLLPGFSAHRLHMHTWIISSPLNLKCLIFTLQVAPLIDFLSPLSRYEISFCQVHKLNT